MKKRAKRAIIAGHSYERVQLEVTAEMIDDVFGFNSSTGNSNITTTFSKLNPKATLKKK
jgi:hypothetical protein